MDSTQIEFEEDRNSCGLDVLNFNRVTGFYFQEIGGVNELDTGYGLGLEFNSGMPVFCTERFSGLVDGEFFETTLNYRDLDLKSVSSGDKNAILYGREWVLDRI